MASVSPNHNTADANTRAIEMDSTVILLRVLLVVPRASIGSGSVVGVVVS